mmetsp:Transcript_20500/g.50553  ORF Transcript_20500/g.50553 Transcript_20500/m.50553 type:complete len:364 (-) Transcript_20500:220-1311(-)
MAKSCYVLIKGKFGVRLDFNQVCRMFSIFFTAWCPPRDWLAFDESLFKFDGCMRLFAQRVHIPRKAAEFGILAYLAAGYLALSRKPYVYNEAKLTVSGHCLVMDSLFGTWDLRDWLTKRGVFYHIAGHPQKSGEIFEAGTHDFPPASYRLFKHKNGEVYFAFHDKAGDYFRVFSSVINVADKPAAPTLASVPANRSVLQGFTSRGASSLLSLSLAKLSELSTNLGVPTGQTANDMVREKTGFDLSIPSGADGAADPEENIRLKGQLVSVRTLASRPLTELKKHANGLGLVMSKYKRKEDLHGAIVKRARILERCAKYCDWLEELHKSDNPISPGRLLPVLGHTKFLHFYGRFAFVIVNKARKI